MCAVAAIYSRAADVTLAKLKQYGQTLAIIRKFEATSDTPWAGSGTTDVEYSAHGIVTRYALSLVDGESIKATDRRVVVAAKGLSIEPTTLDSLRVGTISYTIVSVTPQSPAGTPIAYEIQARI